jgi:hypothetical protein
MLPEIAWNQAVILDVCLTDPLVDREGKAIAGSFLDEFRNGLAVPCILIDNQLPIPRSALAGESKLEIGTPNEIDSSTAGTNSKRMPKVAVLQNWRRLCRRISSRAVARRKYETCRRFLSIAARTERDVIEPIPLHRFVGREIYRTFTEAGSHVNCSRKLISGPVSFSRAKPIPKRPEVVAQRDASTDKTAVHFRSIFCGVISENRISLNAKVGLHICWPAACATLISPMLPVNSPNMHDRFMLVLLPI